MQEETFFSIVNTFCLKWQEKTKYTIVFISEILNQYFSGQAGETPYNADDKEVENILSKKDATADEQPGT